MSRRRTVAAVVVLAVVATLGGCMGTLTGNAAGQVDGPSGNDTATVQVSATGQVEAEPDQSVVRVAVMATGEDATTARDRLAENVSRMREALRQAGIEDDQVRTAFFDIDQDYRETREGREPAGYRAIQAFEVTLSNVTRTGEIIDVAVNNGANRVDGVEFTLADDTRRELRADALRTAVSNARADANVLANASDLEIVGVRAVSTGESVFTPFRAEATTAEADDAATTVEPDPVTVTATVTVTYNATVQG